MEQRRLYRSEQDRMVAGVCAGLGAFFGVDPVLVRVVFVVLAFSGVGILLYLAMWVIVPAESRLDAPPPEVARDGVADMRERARQGAGEARVAIDRLRGRQPQEPGVEPGQGPGGPSGQEPGVPGQEPGGPPRHESGQGPGGPPGEEPGGPR